MSSTQSVTAMEADVTDRVPIPPLPHPYVHGDLADDGRTCRHCGKVVRLPADGYDEPDVQFDHLTRQDHDECLRLRGERMSDQDRLRRWNEYEAIDSAITDHADEICRRIGELFEEDER